MNTDPLRTMRDEMANEYKRLWKFAPNQNCAEFKRLARWLATLDAYLAVPRCPECWTLDVPNVRWNGREFTALCTNMRCQRYAENNAQTEADALAAFYEATP